MFTKKILIIIIILSCSPLIATDYTFYKAPLESHIWTVETYNNETYMLNRNQKGYFISKFDMKSEVFQIVIPQEDLIEHKLEDIIDFTFYDGDLYVVNKNKLINISDGYKEIILGDEFDAVSDEKFFRRLERLIVFRNHLYIGSYSFTVDYRDTLQGTPITYGTDFSELLKLDDSKSSLYRVIDERDYEDEEDLNFDGLVAADDKNIWFAYQAAKLDGGLIKIDSEENLELIDLQSYSGKNYVLRPTSLDIIDNKLYINYAAKQESNYLEGLSIYDIKSKQWTHSIDFLTNNEEIYSGYSWSVPNKVKKLSNGSLAILSQWLTFKYEDQFFYYDIPKLQNNKGIEYDYNRNLDIFQDDKTTYVIRANGILKFDTPLITSVVSDGLVSVEYTVKGDEIEFSDPSPKEYIIYNLVGKVIKSGTVTNRLNLSNLPNGPYFISLDGTLIIKELIED